MTDDRTAEILGRFSASWDEAENRFTPLKYDASKKLLNFIREQRLNGAPQYFRLKTSFPNVLFVTRSVDDGIRDDQKFIRIEVLENNVELIFRNGEKTHRQIIVDDLGDPRVENLLNTLKGFLID